PVPPTIVTAPLPATQTVCPHSTVNFSVVASSPANGGPVVYQWKKNGVAINGATGTMLTLTDVGLSDSGTYTVSVGNDGGATTSVGAVLIVDNVPPSVNCPANITAECT